MHQETRLPPPRAHLGRRSAQPLARGLGCRYRRPVRHPPRTPSAGPSHGPQIPPRRRWTIRSRRRRHEWVRTDGYRNGGHRAAQPTPWLMTAVTISPAQSTSVATEVRSAAGPGTAEEVITLDMAHPILCSVIKANPIRADTQGSRLHRQRSVGRTMGMKGAHNPGQPDQPIRPAALISEGMPADASIRARYQVSHGRRRRHTYQSAGDIACSSSPSTKPLERKSSSYSASEFSGGSNHTYGCMAASISVRSGWSL